MFKTTELLDMLKAMYDLPSDYAIAKKIGLTRGAISSLRLNKSFFSDSNAFNVAELLELDPLKVIASCKYERAHKKGEQELENFWKQVAA
ncbi:MAG: Cro/Cl family transcriptional regulator [Gammaproteobacteria bacterium]|nr:MAG: Cro/Cl family transcriptional regulator [Gammaproteobacteria bacterium]